MKIQEIGQKKWVSSLKSHKLRWAMDKNKKWIGRKNLGHQSILELQLTLIETDLVHSDSESEFEIEYALVPKFCVSLQNGDNKIGDFWEMMNDLLYWDRSSSKCIIAYSKSE